MTQTLSLDHGRDTPFGSGGMREYLVRGASEASTPSATPVLRACLVRGAHHKQMPTLATADRSSGSKVGSGDLAEDGKGGEGKLATQVGDTWMDGSGGGHSPFLPRHILPRSLTQAPPLKPVTVLSQTPSWNGRVTATTVSTRSGTSPSGIRVEGCGVGAVRANNESKSLADTTVGKGGGGGGEQTGSGGDDAEPRTEGSQGGHSHLLSPLLQPLTADDAQSATAAPAAATYGVGDDTGDGGATGGGRGGSVELSLADTESHRGTGDRVLHLGRGQMLAGGSGDGSRVTGERADGGEVRERRDEAGARESRDSSQEKRLDRENSEQGSVSSPRQYSEFGRSATVGSNHSSISGRQPGSGSFRGASDTDAQTLAHM